MRAKQSNGFPHSAAVRTTVRKGCDHCFLLWFPGVFSVWSQEKPPLSLIRASAHDSGRIPSFFSCSFTTRTAITLFAHIVISRRALREKKTQCCSIREHRSHTRDKSFLCRQQSQLCRVRIGSQSERGGWYDVTPPHRPLVRDTRTNQKAAELKWKWKQRTALNGSRTYAG